MVSIDQAVYDIDILRKIVAQHFQEKLNEYQLRNKILVQLWVIMECETALFSSKEDDEQSFRIKMPENASDYNIEIEKWKNN